MSTKADIDKVYVKTLPFSGKEADWLVWSTQFMCLGTQKGWVVSLEGETMPTSYKHVLDETKADKLKLIKARNQKSLAMASITMAIAKNPTCLSFINRSKTPDWPNGLANKVWELLLEHRQSGSM